MVLEEQPPASRSSQLEIDDVKLVVHRNIAAAVAVVGSCCLLEHFRWNQWFSKSFGSVCDVSLCLFFLFF